MLLNLPNPRLDFYRTSNYEVMQRRVTEYTNKLVEKLGYFPVDIKMPILKKMQAYSYAVMFLGLLLDIIVLLFVIVSILLIYSLLMISVETKTFEIGVLRMVGLSKNGLLFMILIQGFMFVAPSVIGGFFGCFVVLWALFKFLFEAKLGIFLEPMPTYTAVQSALLLGIFIPLISSVMPIIAARGKSLNEALDYTHSRTQAAFRKILDPNEKDNGLYVAFGSIGVVYGVTIYYFLPLSLMALDLGLILMIFFFILLGMLLGLTILSLNLQRGLQILVTHLILFFERKSMKRLILKNLTAHKERNKLTSIIYAITLGFVILCIVSYQLEIESSRMLNQKTHGADFRLMTKRGHLPLPVKPIEKILKEYE